MCLQPSVPARAGAARTEARRAAAHANTGAIPPNDDETVTIAYFSLRPRGCNDASERDTARLVADTVKRGA